MTELGNERSCKWFTAQSSSVSLCTLCAHRPTLQQISTINLVSQQKLCAIRERNIFRTLNGFSAFISESSKENMPCKNLCRYLHQSNGIIRLYFCLQMSALPVLHKCYSKAIIESHDFLRLNEFETIFFVRTIFRVVQLYRCFITCVCKELLYTMLKQ